MTLVLMAWGIGTGDAVFIPDFTFFASAETVSYEGATPVFVDVDRDTFNVDVNCLEQAIQQVITEGVLRPRVIVGVDLFGLPENFEEIERIAKKYGLLVLEDGAQGFGGRIGDRVACSFGHAATTSFFPAKPLGCYGDGGAIFTNDDQINDLIRSFKFHGKGTDKYDNVRIGMNSRLDTLQAAILQVKLNAFKEFELVAVNTVARAYDERLSELVKTPVIPEEYYSSWAQYTITLESKAQRDGLQVYLKEQGIPTMLYYPKGMHRQTAFIDLGLGKGDFPVSTELCDTVLSLPMHPYMEMEEIDQVSKAIKDFFEK